jgi:hypothetical protein
MTAALPFADLLLVIIVLAVVSLVTFIVTRPDERQAV